MNNNLQISTTLRFLIGFASLAIALVFMNIAQDMLSALVLAFIIVVTVTPVMYGLQRRHVPGWLAFAITLAVIIGLFAGFVLLLVGSVSKFADAIPTYLDQVENYKSTIEEYFFTLGIDIELDIQAMLSVLDIGSLLEFGADFLSGLVNALSNYILVLIIIIFLLVDALGLPAKVASLLESGNKTIIRLTAFSGDIRRYIGITTMVGLATGILDTIFFLIVGVDFPILWGLMAFLMSYIPTIGFWIALIPPVILAFLEFGLPTAILVFVVIVLINGFAENVIKPKYMGEGLNLSIFVVVFSVFFWAAVLGPLGAILAVPLTMAFKNLVLEADESNNWIAKLMSSGKDQPIPAHDTQAEIGEDED